MHNFTTLTAKNGAQMLVETFKTYPEALLAFSNQSPLRGYGCSLLEVQYGDRIERTLVRGKFESTTLQKRIKVSYLVIVYDEQRQSRFPSGDVVHLMDEKVVLPDPVAKLEPIEGGK